MKTSQSKFAASLIATTALFSFTSIATAQEQEATTEDQSFQETIIVIGTPGGAGTSRQDASFAVTAVSEDDIARLSPQNASDLLKIIPGVWSESNGGAGGANIDVRGLPGGSDSPFVLFTINGSPIYGTNMLSFMDQSVLFRVDETIAGVEGLRGGPNAIFGKGEPGLTVNFNLKEGGPETEGRFKYTTSDYGLQRVDGVLSGEISDDLYYMIGGYVSSSKGIRDTQFQSEEGHQFTLNLTKELSNGDLNFFVRTTNDHTPWHVPFNLNGGFDPGTFIQLGNDTRFREITVNAAGDTETFDFADGRGFDGTVAGGSAEIDLGNGFTLRDKFTYTKASVDTLGFVAAGAAVQAGALTSGATPIVTGPVQTTAGQTLSDTDFVQTYGHWVVFKDIDALINDLSISKSIGSHDLTAGLYSATWSTKDRWHLGNPIAVHNAHNGSPLAGVTPTDIANAGGNAGFSFGLVESGDATSTAFYLADSWQIIDPLRLDVGLRYENAEIDTVVDTGPGYADGTIDTNSTLDLEETSYTVALNYDFSDDLATFVRYTDGYTLPDFDDIRGGSPQTLDINQTEAGLKFNNGTFQVYATAFMTETTNFLNVVGGTGAQNFETESLGVELEGIAELGNFVGRVTATFQDTEIVAANTAAVVGNKVLRQPDYQVRFSPSYTIEGSGFQTTIYGGLSLVGERFGNNGNTVVLPEYEKFDLGIQTHFDNGVFFQIHGDNLNDSDGITEGDPRNPTAPNGRPIFGSSVKLSIGYDF